MIERYGNLETYTREAAVYAIHRCAQNLVSVDDVTSYVINEWRSQAKDQEGPPHKLLKRLALRYCSSCLYLSCCSLDPQVRNFAFDNLRRFLQRALERSSYAKSLANYASAAEDVLQLTLADLHRLLRRHPPGGPDDPAAFLRWSQTILLHHACTFLERAKREATISLEAQTESYLELNARDELPEQIEAIFTRELQQILLNAIRSLRNPRYRHVLIAMFMAGMEEQELAASMGAQVQEIYLWRHRALKALRKNREVAEALQLWLR
jgi:RNA polymerase sigma factor (sigma-70 family)